MQIIKVCTLWEDQSPEANDKILLIVQRRHYYYQTSKMKPINSWRINEAKLMKTSEFWLQAATMLKKTVKKYDFF